MTSHTFRLAVVKLLFASLVLASSTLNAAQRITAVWRTGSTGNWNDASRWSTRTNFPNNNGAQSYFAAIDSGTVTLNQPIAIDQLTLGETGFPTLQGTNILDVRSKLALNHGLITGNSTLNALGAATISGNSNLYGWRLTLSGSTNWSGRLGVGNASVIDNLPGATLDLWPGAICTYYNPISGNPNGPRRTINNYGTINANSNGAVILDVTLNNLGTINVNSGSLVLMGGGTYGGPINLGNGATLDFENSDTSTGTNYVFTQTASISGPGSVKVNSWSNTSIQGLYNIAGTTTVSGLVSFLSPITNLGTLVVSGQFASCDLGANFITVSNLNLRSGTLTGSGTVTVDGPFEWNEGSMSGQGTTTAQDGVFFNGLTGLYGYNFLDRVLNCYGSSSVQTTAAYMGILNFGLHAALNVMPGATFNGSRLMISGSNTSGFTNGSFTNYGTLVIDDPSSGHGMVVLGTAFINEGNIRVTNNKLDVRSSANPPAFVQNAGSLQLENGTLACDRISINGGTLSGYGTVGKVVNNGVIAPSRALTCVSPLNLQSNSILAFGLGGTQAGVSFGYINGYSTATLGGALQVTLTNGFQSQIQPSDTFTVLIAQSVTGQFTNVVNGGRLSTTDGSGSFVVTYYGNQVVLSNYLAN